MTEYLNWVPAEVYDMIGVAGFALYVVSYILVSVGRVKSEQVLFFAMNWWAATLVLIGLTSSFNLASALIQVFWIAISTLGIFLRLRRQRQTIFTSIRNRGFTPT